MKLPKSKRLRKFFLSLIITPIGEYNMTETFPCPACGAPNVPKVGATQMACSYCGANLAIPESLRTAAIPKVERPPAMSAPAPSLEKEAPDLLRKAEPIITKAWNTYAAWTWIRRALPTCLIVALVGLCICVVLGALPFILNSIGR